MVLPVIALSLLPSAYVARIMRASMLEVMNQDYIRTAHAKGLANNVVIIRHAIKNSLIPVLTVMGPIFAALVTGSLHHRADLLDPGDRPLLRSGGAEP